jgi:hypothetical protein
MSNFKNSDDEVKHGRYANAFIYFLMAVILTVIPILFWDNKKLRKENNSNAEKWIQREDVIRRECAEERREEQREDDKRFEAVQQELRDLRNQTIADLREEREKSEDLATQSRRALRSIQVETKKTKQANKELDSVSKSLTQ